MEKIVQQKNKILRVRARPVPVHEIVSSKIKSIIEDLKNTMHSVDDAVAIAAPQIGVSLRIFVVSGKVFYEFPAEHAEKKDAGETEHKKFPPREKLPPDLVCINPEITKLSKKQLGMEEGCLSVRWLYGEVKRAEKATIRAHDEHGKLFTRGGSGLLAQIFQHETDHLDGVLFIDKAKNVHEMKPRKEN